MNVFVIAEAGVNHNGDESLALRLIEVAARSGADAVKFQTFSADRLVRPGAEKAEYQKRETGGGDQHSLLKSLEISEDSHRRLYQRCMELGIEFMSTPFDEEAVDFLIALGMKRIKIPSGEITNEPFLEYVAAKGLPLILSTGMSSLQEITRAIQVIGAAWESAGHRTPLVQALTVLHCTSNYPALYCDVNLRAMSTIATETGMPVGYSDHTLGTAVSTAAIAMGAVVIEKHFTLDTDMSGPDHKASLPPDELTRLVRQIREVQVALGSDVKQPAASELAVRELVRRSVTTVRPLMTGEVIRREDIALMRPGTGLAPRYFSAVIGKTAARDVPAGITLQWSDMR